MAVRTDSPELPCSLPLVFCCLGLRTLPHLPAPNQHSYLQVSCTVCRRSGNPEGVSDSIPSDSASLVARHVLSFMLPSFLCWRLSLGEKTGSILVTLFLHQIKQFGWMLVFPRKAHAEGKIKLSLWRQRKSCRSRKDLSFLPRLLIQQQHLHVCISSAFLDILTVSKAR